MHEVGIATSIVATVSDVVGDAPVAAVAVRVGALSGVVPHALEFAWDVVTIDTPLAGSRLEVTFVPTSVFCVTCDELVEPELGFLCPGCGRLSGDVRAGRELEITSARLADDAEPVVGAG